MTEWRNSEPSFFFDTMRNMDDLSRTKQNLYAALLSKPSEVSLTSSHRHDVCDLRASVAAAAADRPRGRGVERFAEDVDAAFNHTTRS